MSDHAHARGTLVGPIFDEKGPAVLAFNPARGASPAVPGLPRPRIAILRQQRRSIAGTSSIRLVHYPS
jgi:hypothetical protein